jgi:hypothetical protein
MSHLSSPPTIADEIPITFQSLSRRLPDLGLPFKHGRAVTVIYGLGMAVLVIGGLLTVIAKKIGPAANSIGWTGIYYLYAGLAILGLLVLSFFVWTMVGVVRAPKLLLAHLDSTFEQEMKLVRILRTHDAETLGERGRYARVQAQLADKVAVIAGIIGAGTAATSNLLKAWEQSRALEADHQMLQYLPTALALGICMAALMMVGHAGRLSRISNLYDEAARQPDPAQSGVSLKSATRRQRA